MAVGHVCPAEDAELQHLLRRHVQREPRREVSADRLGAPVDVTALHPIGDNHLLHRRHTWFRHQLDRMRPQIDLVSQIQYPAAPDVMGEQRERHHQRHTPTGIVPDVREQFGPALAVKRLLEVPEHVLQHVGVPARRGEGTERRH